MKNNKLYFKIIIFWYKFKMKIITGEILVYIRLIQKKN